MITYTGSTSSNESPHHLKCQQCSGVHKGGEWRAGRKDGEQHTEQALVKYLLNKCEGKYRLHWGIPILFKCQNIIRKYLSVLYDFLPKNIYEKIQINFWNLMCYQGAIFKPQQPSNIS